MNHEELLKKYPRPVEPISDGTRMIILDDFAYRIALGPNNEDSIGAYEFLDELNRIAELAETLRWGKQRGITDVKEL